MSAPTGRLKFAYDSIANFEQQIATLRAQLAAAEARAKRYEAALVAVQNFPSHPGGHPDDQSSDADDAASWRHGWICAVGAMQDRALPGEQTKAETDFEISILRAKVAAAEARAERLLRDISTIDDLLALICDDEARDAT